MTSQHRSQDHFHSRGYLPHVDARNAMQFVTFRLADSMPNELLAAWRSELAVGGIIDVEMRKRIEVYLDSGRGSCWLRDGRVASMISETLRKWDGERYDLVAWVIMPNHVHMLISLRPGHSLSEVMHSIKSYTAHAANKLLGRSGQFWSVESFDRYLRDKGHLESVVRYIEENPVKAGLCSRAEGWAFGSASLSG